MHGEGVRRNERKGKEAWRRAVQLAPASGAGEAAYHLASLLQRKHAGQAQAYLQLAQDLQFEYALEN